MSVLFWCILISVQTSCSPRRLSVPPPCHGGEHDTSVSTFARGEPLPRPLWTHCRYFHHVPPPGFCDLLPFLLAPWGVTVRTKVFIAVQCLCGCHGLGSHAGSSSGGGVFSMGASPWLLSHLYLGHCCTADSLFSLPAKAPLARPVACHSLTRLGHWSLWPSSVGQPCWRWVGVSAHGFKRAVYQTSFRLRAMCQTPFHPPYAEPCSPSLYSCRHQATRLGIQLCGQ